MNLLIMQFPPTSCHFISLWSLTLCEEYRSRASEDGVLKRTYVRNAVYRLRAAAVRGKATNIAWRGNRVQSIHGLRSRE
jgi:hypothetical protein